MSEPQTNRTKSCDYFQSLKKCLLTEYKHMKELEERWESGGISVRCLNPGNSPQSPLPRVANVAFDLNDSQQHHVEMYKILGSGGSGGIFRRGQMFKMCVQFDRPFNVLEDQLYLTVAYGPSANASRGTLHHLRVTEQDPIHRDRWLAWIAGGERTDVIVNVYTPVNCQVGIWRYRFDVMKQNQSVSMPTDTFGADHITFYVLFNPWNTKDDVYLGDDELRKECVLADHGKIYTGSQCCIKEQNWAYGQFDYVVLPAVILLLEHSALPHSERGSAVLMARALSAVVSSEDDNGLLDGNWSGEYGPGTTNPLKWTGSLAIYEEYIRKGGENQDDHVKYGQCLTFAGCLTTACRALGLPCRTVTCYDAGKELDLTLTVDFYYDVNMSPTQGKNPYGKDSVWNYHCWNEVWMTRPDLDGDMGGWQVVDATPQFLSGGLKRMGPAPLKAVREGEMLVKYDVALVYMEVSCDLCFWMEDRNRPGEFKVSCIDTNRVGSLIVTEHGSRMEVRDSFYKYSKSTLKGREIFEQALKQLPSNSGKENIEYYSKYKIKEHNDISFDLQRVPSVSYGQPFHVTLAITNNSFGTPWTVNVKLQAYTVLHTGELIDMIKEGLFVTKFKMLKSNEPPPPKTCTEKLNVSYDDYKTKIQKASSIKLVAFCSDANSGQVYHTEHVLEVLFPQLQVVAPRSLRSNTESQIDVSFRNPTEHPLTGCHVQYEGPGLCRPRTEVFPDIPPGAEVVKVLNMTPLRSGPSVLITHLFSDQLPTIAGSTVLTIQE